MACSKDDVKIDILVDTATCIGMSIKIVLLTKKNSFNDYNSFLIIRFFKGYNQQKETILPGFELHMTVDDFVT